MREMVDTEELEEFVGALFALELRRGGMRKMLSCARRLLEQRGERANPFGCDASKLGLPASYRPVTGSCPPCPLHDAGCYAQTGRVQLVQQRAEVGVWPSLLAAAVVLVVAARYRKVARLHVSGDFYREGKLDVEYLQGLIMIGELIRDQRNARLVGYSYTHAPAESFELWRLLLLRAGIMVRYSSLQPQAPSAVVYPFEHLDVLERQHPKLRMAKCRAQLDEITQCVDCGLCWKHDELTIVFDPHGPHHEAMRARLGDSFFT